MLYDRPVLALDVDGVLLDYVSAIAAYAVSLGHELGCRPEEIEDWEMTKLLQAIPKEDRPAFYMQFSLAEMFGSMTPYHGAQEAVLHLRSTFPEMPIVAVTSAGVHAETERMRRLNLEAFPFDDIFMLPIGGSKREHLSRLPKGSVFVDDLEKNVDDAEAVGLVSVLFRQPYNRDVDHPRAIDDWSEGRVLIEGLLQAALAREPALA